MFTIKLWQGVTRAMWVVVKPWGLVPPIPPCLYVHNILQNFDNQISPYLCNDLWSSSCFIMFHHIGYTTAAFSNASFSKIFLKIENKIIYSQSFILTIILKKIGFVCYVHSITLQYKLRAVGKVRLQSKKPQ